MKLTKSKRAIALIVAFALLLSCTFAYFSDFVQDSASGKAGTVAVSLDSGINLLDAEGRDILNPGDQRDAGFTVTNEGNKSIDVRTTIVLTTQSKNAGVDLTFSGAADAQSEYDLYLRSDVDYVDGKGYMPKDGAQPLQVKSIDQDTITYILPEYVLNGNSDKYDEVETADEADGFSKASDFVMIFKGDAGNEWQNSMVQIDVLVEAKQHENTAAGWDIVAQEQVATGAINQMAVKGENIITDGVNAPADEDEKKTYIPVISKNENGEDLNATSSKIEGELADTLLEALDNQGLANSEDVDLLIDVESDDFDGMADTTFDVSDVAKEGDTVIILHYNEETEEWEYIATDTVDENLTVGGDFSSYSPVGFIIIPKEDDDVEGDLPEEVEYTHVLQDIGLRYDGSNGESPVLANLLNNTEIVLPPTVTGGSYDDSATRHNHNCGIILNFGYDITIATVDESGRIVMDENKLIEAGVVGNSDKSAAWSHYNFTSYEIIASDENSTTVKFICDEADFSGVNLQPSFDLDGWTGSADFIACGIAVEDGKLTQTITFDHEYTEIPVTVVDMNGMPVANANVGIMMSLYDDIESNDVIVHNTCFNNFHSFQVITDENGQATLVGESNSLPYGEYNASATVTVDGMLQTYWQGGDYYNNPMSVLSCTNPVEIDGSAITLTVDTPPVVNFTIVDADGNKWTDNTINVTLDGNNSIFGMNDDLDKVVASMQSNAFVIKSINNQFQPGTFRVAEYELGHFTIGEVSEGVTVDGNKITMAGSATYEVELVIDELFDLGGDDGVIPGPGSSESPYVQFAVEDYQKGSVDPIKMNITETSTNLSYDVIWDGFYWSNSLQLPVGNYAINYYETAEGIFNTNEYILEMVFTVAADTTMHTVYVDMSGNGGQSSGGGENPGESTNPSIQFAIEDQNGDQYPAVTNLHILNTDTYNGYDVIWDGYYWSSPIQLPVGNYSVSYISTENGEVEYNKIQNTNFVITAESTQITITVEFVDMFDTQFEVVDQNGNALAIQEIYFAGNGIGHSAYPLESDNKLSQVLALEEGLYNINYVLLADGTHLSSWGGEDGRLETTNFNVTADGLIEIEAFIAPSITVTVQDANGNPYDAVAGQLNLFTEGWAESLWLTQDASDLSKFTMKADDQALSGVVFPYMSLANNQYDVSVSFSEDNLDAVVVIDSWEAYDVTFHIVDNSTLGQDSYYIEMGNIRINVADGSVVRLPAIWSEIKAANNDFRISPENVNINAENTEITLTIEDPIRTTVNFVGAVLPPEQQWVNIERDGSDGNGWFSYGADLINNSVTFNNVKAGTYRMQIWDYNTQTNLIGTFVYDGTNNVIEVELSYE